MDEKRKAISADDRLRALALFTMAKEHERKATEFEKGLMRVLCVTDSRHLGDLLWGRHEFSIAEFDEALENMGIAVLPEEG